MLPTLAHVLINRAVPVNQGAEIALAHGSGGTLSSQATVILGGPTTF